MRQALAALALIGMASPVSAALFDRGGGMIYDDRLDVTWLANANLGAGSAFDDGSSDTDGLMTWENAVAWVDNLVYGGFDDWRLPSMDVNGDQDRFGNGIADCGGMLGLAATETECRDSELGYMYYYNLGGAFLDNLTGDQGLFTNIQVTHWSGTEAVINPEDGAWALIFANGRFEGLVKSQDLGVWAVRDGDIGVIPIPAAIWLFASALAGLGTARRRK